jgi:hypothetical protein
VISEKSFVIGDEGQMLEGDFGAHAAIQLIHPQTWMKNKTARETGRFEVLGLRLLLGEG